LSPPLIKSLRIPLPIFLVSSYVRRRSVYAWL